MSNLPPILVSIFSFLMLLKNMRFIFFIKIRKSIFWRTKMGLSLQVLTPLQVGTCNGAVCLQCTYTVASTYTICKYSLEFMTIFVY